MTKKTLKIGILSVVAGSALFSFAVDMADFHRIQSGAYGTPWYDARWWRNPYTALRVALAESQTRWTKNAVGDDWHVRETTINGKRWWTVLEKREASLPNGISGEKSG